MVDTTEMKPPPPSTEDRTRESMVMEEGSNVTGQKRVELFKISKQIEVKSLTLLETNDYMRDLLEKKEERLRVREEEIGLLEESVSRKLGLIEEKHTESDLLLEFEASLLRLVLGKQIEQVVTQLEKRENVLGLLRHSVTQTFNGLMSEFEGKKEEARLLVESINEKLCRVEGAEKEQRVESERLSEESKQLEARKNELNLLEDAIKDKMDELERKKKTFGVEPKEMKEFELSKMVLAENTTQQLINAATRKRSRLEMEPLMVENDNFLTCLPKKHKSHAGDLVGALSETTEDPAAKKNSDASAEGVGGMVSTNILEPLICPDTTFNDFSKSMSSFAVDQVWALHDPTDDMPRIYALIKNIFNSQLSLQVTLLEHVKTTKDENSVIYSCGKFEYGDTEIKSHLMFVHEMYHIKCGDNVIVNPRKGETWALFRDWDITWNTQLDLLEPPYRYDFVEVISEFDDKQGIAVAYMGRVNGFVSVFNHAEQHGFVKIMISLEEMQRFSHKVESVELSGEEKEGVPDGSFELNTAATPSYNLGLDHYGNGSTVKDQVEST